MADMAMKKQSKGFRQFIGRHKRKALLLILLVLLGLVFTNQSSSFLKPRNLMSIGLEGGTVGILACGMTMVIICGGIDLSCSSLIALDAMLCFKVFVANPDFNAYVMMAIILVMNLIVGLYHGFVVTKMNVPDFIVTLSSQIILRGLTIVIAPLTEAGTILNVNIKNKAFLSLYNKVELFGMDFRIVFFAFIIVVIISQLILKYTRKGVSIYAVGTNAKSAELTGISVVKTKTVAYMYSALMTGIAALFMCARVGTGTADLANGYEMDVIAATIVGGTAFSGGRGDVVGSAIGAIFLAAMENGIYKFPNVSTSLMPVIIGLIILVSIMFDQILIWISGSVKRSKLRKKGA